MKYIRARNWWKFQKYFTSVENNPPWIKLYNSLLGDNSSTNWSLLDAKQRGELVSIWLLLSRNNGVFPAIADLISSECGLPDAVDIESLADSGWIVIHDDKESCAEACARDRALREEEYKNKESKKEEKKEKKINTCREVLNFLNDERGLDGRRRFRATAGTMAPISARLADGFDAEDLKAVIRWKIFEWSGKTWQHNGREISGDNLLNTQTLFGPQKFPRYRDEALAWIDAAAKKEEAGRLRAALDQRIEEERRVNDAQKEEQFLRSWDAKGRPKGNPPYEYPEHIYMTMCERCDEIMSRRTAQKSGGCES